MPANQSVHKKTGELNLKQKEFCQQYLIDLNATQAAIRAGYSKKTACEGSQQLLANIRVQAYLAELMAERAKRTQISQDEVIQELKRCGLSDMRKFAQWDGDSVTLEDSKDMDENDARCVAQVSQTTTEHGGSISFKLHDKVKALELLARHLGMLNDKLDHTNKGGKFENPPPIIVATKEQAENIKKVLGGE